MLPPSRPPLGHLLPPPAAPPLPRRRGSLRAGPAGSRRGAGMALERRRRGRRKQGRIARAPGQRPHRRAAGLCRPVGPEQRGDYFPAAAAAQGSRRAGVEAAGGAAAGAGGAAAAQGPSGDRRSGAGPDPGGESRCCHIAESTQTCCFSFLQVQKMTNLFTSLVRFRRLTECCGVTIQFISNLHVL